jgi:hypothetical protein
METMQQTGMPATMAPDNVHKDIPGNPSTATSSKITLSDRSAGQPLRVLSEADWAFWKENGYIVVKQAVPKEQAQRLADLLWEFEEKDPLTLRPGMPHPAPKCR